MIPVVILIIIRLELSFQLGFQKHYSDSMRTWDYMECSSKTLGPISYLSMLIYKKVVQGSTMEVSVNACTTAEMLAFEKLYFIKELVDMFVPLCIFALMVNYLPF